MVHLIEVSSREYRSIFYSSREWRNLREEVLRRDNYECQWCKAEGRVRTEMHSVLEVDHIKELEFYPELALDKENLRVL